MPNQIENQIKERIQSFVTELERLVRKSALEALRGFLNGTAAPARRGRRPGRPPAGRRGSLNVERAGDTILAHVRANDGQGVGQISAATGVPLKTAKKVIGRLVSSGQLKKTGQKRGTKYHIGSWRAPRAIKGGKRRRKAS
jgi:hypothetical protein